MTNKSYATALSLASTAVLDMADPNLASSIKLNKQ